MPQNQTPVVAIVGRINVGKSTLFNRLIGEKRALVSAEPGTTRDRREGEVYWRDQKFILVDTGGVEAISQKSSSEREKIETQIKKQTEIAIDKADLSLLIVDASDGLMPQDRFWANRLRQKPTILVVNKADNAARSSEASVFYDLGMGEPNSVSAINGRGTGDLLDEVVARLKQLHRHKKNVDNKSQKKIQDKKEDKPLTVAILGQPNSGKSTLTNAILGEERTIVSATPHTTREPIDTIFEYNGRPFVLIDTAGIRRQAHVTKGVEMIGVKASLKIIDHADIILLVIDAVRGITRQDQRLVRYITDHNKGLVIVINKWDLVADKTHKTMQLSEQKFRQMMPGSAWAPMIFISAKYGKRVKQALNQALSAETSASLLLSEEDLLQFVKGAIKKHLPTKRGGVRHPKIMSFKQIHTTPPIFEITARGELHPSYLKFLENRLREYYGFTGAPIKITMKQKRKKVKK